MKFTKATAGKVEAINIDFQMMNGLFSIEVSNSSKHIKDQEIRAELKTAGFDVTQNRGQSYKVTGGTPEDLKKIEGELNLAYGLVEEAEDVALLSKIAIEIAIGAAKADSRRQRLTTENFPPGFDVVKAAKTDGFMAVCLETARNILEILK